MALADYAALHLHMGAEVHHNSAAVGGCIAALDPAALERDVRVGGSTNTTSRDACAVGDCALHQYSPRALPDGEPTWVRKEQERMGAAAHSWPRDTARWELRVRERGRREGRVGPQKGIGRV